MFEKIGVYGVVLTAHVVLNGAKETYTLKMGDAANLLI